MSTTRLSTTVLLAAAALATGGATECGAVLDDSGFDLWCAPDRLCAWQLDKGEVRRAPTWHRDDAGVELVGDDVAISQLSPIDGGDPACVRFTLVADVEETAEVFLDVDVYGDGTVEHSERIPTSDWRKLTYLLRMPERYEGARFRLRKRGSGRAVLANIGGETTADADCPGEAIPTGPRPLGASCTGDAECAGGLCDGDAEIRPGVIWPGTCAACTADGDCPGGQLCARAGTHPGPLAVPRTCVAPGLTPIGVACERDAECASGLCDGAVCAGCRTAADCDGRTCETVRFGVDHLAWDGPQVCGPGGAPGAACLTGAECASGVCGGDVLRLCLFSGRECVVETDCPTFGNDGEESCVTVGSRGGSCQ
ncbi:MAG TPA: hypothetical protein VM734_00010 [Kofleriaceae bacterium]|nr:hypothetical protein [Kofleriaceae bacterium]